MKTLTFLSVSLSLSISMFLGTVQAQSTMTSTHYFNDFSGTEINDVNCSITSTKAMQQLNNEMIVTADGFNAKGQAVLLIEFANALDMSNNSVVSLEVQARNLVMADGTTTSIRIFPSLYDVNGLKTTGDNFDWQFNATISNAAGWVSKQLNMATYPGTADFTKIKKLRLNYQTSATVTSGSIVFRKVELGLNSSTTDNLKIDSKIVNIYSIDNQLKIENLSTNNNLSFEVVNLSGMKVQSGSIEGSSVSLTLPKGAYIVKILNGFIQLNNKKVII